MESVVTALQMRRKFGGLLDEVVRRKAHITIMRGHRPLATLIPSQEHEQNCSSRNRIQTIQEALVALETWREKNRSKVRRMSRANTVGQIRTMRENRWSSLTPR